MRPDEALALADWRRRVAELYATVRAAPEPSEGWLLWRRARDDLFRSHPQSPLGPADMPTFEGLAYFSYDPAMRVTSDVTPVEESVLEIPTSDDRTMRFTRVARLEFALNGNDLSLDLYWLESYSGGLFVPFRDTTCGSETYGAGRYLLDSAKGADLGVDADGRLVLDFNFAYNPSCSYDSRWVCPLAPPGNRLEVPVRAGERHRKG